MFTIRSITRIIIEKKDVIKAMNLILRESIPYIKNNFGVNGTLEIIIFTKHTSKFKKIFDDYKIESIFSPPTGLSSLAFKNKKRVGLLVGIALLVVISILSSKFVWEINVFGNETLTEEEILNSLNNAGIALGSYIPSIDYKSLHNKILLELQEISWVSVNITGNIANVYIKETLKDNSDTVNKDAYANLVAKYDGQIALINVIDGVKKINIGDTVKKGDLLISGVINSNSQGTRYVKAQGEVRAYVNKNISIKIPFVQKVKRYTNEVNKQYYVKIFNKNIFFLRNSSNYGEFYDTIEKKEQIVLFDKIKLPIYKTVLKTFAYEIVEETYSKEQAVDLAFKKLRFEMDDLLKDAELISKDIITSYDEDNFYIECELYCLENIAISAEFFVENSGG